MHFPKASATFRPGTTLLQAGLVVGAIYGLIFLAYVSVAGTIGIFASQYVVETVGLMLGREIDIAWWQGFLLGCVPVWCVLQIPTAALVWVLGLFVL